MTEKSFFAGFGGQGIISLGQLWVYFAMQEGKNVTFFPFYGAEKRGGIARASVIISDEEIASPLVTTPDSTLVMNIDSLPLCEKIVKDDGLILINSSLVKEDPKRNGLKVVKIEASGIAEQIGNVVFANMVAFGAMAKLTGAINFTDNHTVSCSKSISLYIEGILKKFFPVDKHQYIPMNVKAIQAGYTAV